MSVTDNADKESNEESDKEPWFGTEEEHRFETEEKVGEDVGLGNMDVGFESKECRHEDGDNIRAGVGLKEDFVSSDGVGSGKGVK